MTKKQTPSLFTTVLLIRENVDNYGWPRRWIIVSDNILTFVSSAIRASFETLSCVSSKYSITFVISSPRAVHLEKPTMTTCFISFLHFKVKGKFMMY